MKFRKIILGMAFLLAVTATFANNGIKRLDHPWGFIKLYGSCMPYRTDQEYCLPTGVGTKCTVNLGGTGTFDAFSSSTCTVPLYQVFP